MLGLVFLFIWELLNVCTFIENACFNYLKILKFKFFKCINISKEFIYIWGNLYIDVIRRD